MTRSLVVARWSPWPPTSGSRLRSANVIAALAELGIVDVFLLGQPDEVPLAPPPGLAVGRLGAVTRRDRWVSRRERLTGLVPGRLPAAVRASDTAEIRQAFSSWCTDAYDVAWFVRIESWLAVGDLVDAPAIVDFDDLRDHLGLSRLGSSWPDGTGKRARRDWSRVLADVADVRAWRRLQRDVARRVEAVAVCSELDLGRLGVPNAVIVPNGIDLPEAPVGRREIGRPPELCLHGSLGYGPNIDAAARLVRDVAPRVRARLGDVVVRLAGRSSRQVDALAAPGEVVVTGAVPDMAAELARVDVVAVPLRQGAGTRIKVLEAMAHRIPVVATSIAVEGLHVTDGEHLLIADGPDAFAEACVRLLTDESLRQRLVDAGETLVRTSYGWDHAHRAVSDAARRIARSSPG
jgi:glycosyltransferase involved in cell wall biosynthesis